MSMSRRKNATAALLVAALLLVAAPQSANAQLSGILGALISLGGGLNTINFLLDDVTLTLQAVAGATVTLTAVGSGPNTMCTGCTPFPMGLLGGTVGYTLQITGSVSNIVLSGAALGALSSNPISGSAPAACLQAVGGGYAYFPATYNSGTRKCSASLPASSGTYIFAAVQTQVSASLGSAVRLCANSPQTITYGTSVALQLASSAAQNALVCTTSTTATVGAAVLAQAGVALGAFINLAGQVAGAFNGVVSYTYTQAQLDAIGCDLSAGAILKVALFDAAGCGCWTTPSSGLTVNTALRVITQVVVGVNVVLPIGIFCQLPAPPAPVCNFTCPTPPAPPCFFCTGICPPAPPAPANCPALPPPPAACPATNPACGTCPALPPPFGSCPAAPPTPANCPARAPPCASCPAAPPAPSNCPALPPPAAPCPAAPVIPTCPALPPPCGTCPAAPPAPALCPQCPALPPPCGTCPACPATPANCPARPAPPAACPTAPAPTVCPARQPPAGPCPSCPAAPANCPALPPPPAACPAIPPPPAACPACPRPTGTCPSCPAAAPLCPARPPPCGTCPACPAIPPLPGVCSGAPAPNLLGNILCTGGLFNIGGLISGTLSGALSATLSVSVISALPVPAPSGCTGVVFAPSLGGGVGLSIQASTAAAVLSNVIVTTPPVAAASLSALLAAGNTPACFVLNTATSTWVRVAVSTFNSATGSCTFTCGSACANSGAAATTVLVAAANAFVPGP